MQYEVPPRRRSAGGIVLAIFLLGFLFLIGVAVFGIGVLTFFRADAHRAQVIVQRDMAMRQVEEARARAEQLRARAEEAGNRVAAEAHDALARVAEATDLAAPTETDAEKGSIRVAEREVTIQLDETGKIQVDGKACELPQLKELLNGAGQGREDAIIVIVKADKRCLFEPVAGVLAVCKELGLPHVRIAALGD
jgi:biopolymer transport protein ExbD